MKLIKKYYKEIFVGLLIGIILLNIIQRFFIIATIPSESMQTTLMVSDKVYIKTNIKDIERGKIYTFIKDDTYLIKRCIGIGGDHIQIKDNEVYLNGELLKESYVSSNILDSDHFDLDIIVPEGTLFFLGDNRMLSYDARFWDDKFVNEEDVIGLATKIIYPFNRIKSLY